MHEVSEGTDGWTSSLYSFLLTKSKAEMAATEDGSRVLYQVKFGVLLFIQVPSMITSLLIFWFFATHRRLLREPRHQALFLLLAINFLQLTFDLPMPMHFYRIGYIAPATPAYCTWWTFFEYNLEVTTAMLMATNSIQRHILIFHEHLLRIPWTCSLIHYLPLLICLVYPVTFYLIVIVFYPCDGTQWDYSSNVCGYANCHLVYNRVLATFDWTAHNGLPTVVIMVANATLILRVVNQKRRHQQRIVWKKQRRITVQLLSISALFLIAWLPSLIIALVQQLINPNFLVEVQKDYMLDLLYSMCLFLPWICLRQLPRASRWLRKQLCRREHATRNIIGPI